MKIKTKLILKAIPLWWVFRRSRKLAKKIVKWQDENRYPFLWRHKYVNKKNAWFMKLVKTNITTEGWENLPKKGGAFIVSNHCSSGDPSTLIIALTNPSPNPKDPNHLPTFIAKNELKKNKFQGLMDIIDSFYLDRDKPREALKTFDNFSNFVKKNQTFGIVFAEGTRSEDGTIKEFKRGAFKMAKKHFIPIVPTTIINSYASSDFKRSKVLEVKVIFHKPIKPMKLMTMKEADIATMVHSIVESAWIPPTPRIGDNDKKVA